MLIKRNDAKTLNDYTSTRSRKMTEGLANIRASLFKDADEVDL